MPTRTLPRRNSLLHGHFSTSTIANMNDQKKDNQSDQYKAEMRQAIYIAIGWFTAMTLAALALA